MAMPIYKRYACKIAFTAILTFVGCNDVEHSLDTSPKLVTLNEKENHIACDGGVNISQENQGKYAVRFRELNGNSIGTTDVHGVERVETLDLNDGIRDNFGLYLTGDSKQDSLLRACLGVAATARPSAVPTEGLPGNPYKHGSPCWQWYNQHPQDKNVCKDDQNSQ
jgi:hypothetical protein